MEESYLYHQIAESIRREILEGRLLAGDRLPSVRAMTARWNCTPGTAQRAYQELAQQGLVTLRHGQGTRVVEHLPAIQNETPLRRAALVHRAENFLLESLTAGHTVDEIEQAVRLAFDRWRSVEQSFPAASGPAVRFAGSHDPAVAWLAAHFNEIAAPGALLDVLFCGSLGGLIALAEGRAELAGSHLWDSESGEYNLPFVRRLLPGRRVALVTLSERRLGLILPPGNPLGVRALADLASAFGSGSQRRFVNRQPGSGTRVWLDAQLARLGIDPLLIEGYSDERLTHTEVARAIAEDQAGAGLGLQASALAYGLDFIELTLERYELVIPAEELEKAAVQALAAWLATPAAQVAIGALGGCDTTHTGEVRWV